MVDVYSGMEVVRALPLPPWTDGLVGIGACLVLLVLLARWLPIALGEVHSNWQRFLSDTLGTGSTDHAASIIDRRSGLDRRSGTDRRVRQIPVAVERRSGIDRRQHARRSSRPTILLSG